jgi:hypothetical protein
MSSDLLAYGASDRTLIVCSVSEKPSVIKQLNVAIPKMSQVGYTSIGPWSLFNLAQHTCPWDLCIVFAYAVFVRMSLSVQNNMKINVLIIYLCYFVSF